MRSSTEAFEYSGVATRLPVQDLNRARSFYASKLGLEPIEERPEGLLYRCGTGLFALFASSGSPSGTHTDSEGNLLGMGQPLR
jgi:catechol 2,3-dioxygenase-like lactoylglutathione lyase family enzyme